MELSEIKRNPNNPRVIKDDRFDKLKKSIEEFPKMMKLRPMVINGDNIVLGGNMRLKALSELGYKEIPDENLWMGEDSQLVCLECGWEGFINELKNSGECPYCNGKSIF